MSPQLGTYFPVANYDLESTLDSGQAFRWERHGPAWHGVVCDRWVELTQVPRGVRARVATPVRDWGWLRTYLQVDLPLSEVFASFPQDAPLTAAVAACNGLRLLRQDPWECLASFILSSTKQIVQIRQVISTLCQRLGNPLPTPPDAAPTWSFPTAEQVARAGETELRECKMGFRAPNLLKTAALVASGEVRLHALQSMPLEDARAALLQLPGVGRKIADCVLLFSLGFQQAFPVDVWILRALRDLYFPCRSPKPARLREFADTHFGPYAGHAQQYLFHYMRTKKDREPTQSRHEPK